MDIKRKIIEYVSANIITASSFIFLLFGGLIFLIYYLDIRYLPDLNLITSVTLLAFASFTGIILLFSTMFMLIFPGYFWNNSVQDIPEVTNIWYDNQSKKIKSFLYLLLWFSFPKLKIENDLCIFPNMYILSNLGKKSYVAIEIKDNKTKNQENKNIRLTLPSSSIVSYSVKK